MNLKVHGNTHEKKGLHKTFKRPESLKKPAYGMFLRKKETAEISHLVTLCITVFSICAAVVGVAAWLGSFEITLHFRYKPRNRKNKGKEKQRRGYFRVAGK